MLRSLRARLVLFCVLPLVVAGVVMAPLALRAFDDYQSQRNEEALRQLQEQSAALAALYGKQVRRYFEEGGEPAPVDQELATVTGADLYYVDRLDGILPAEAVALPVLAAAWTSTGTRSTAASRRPSRSVALPGRDGTLPGGGDGRLHHATTRAARRTSAPSARSPSRRRSRTCRARAPTSSGASPRPSPSPSWWRCCSRSTSAGRSRGRCAGWCVAAGAIGRGRYDVQLDRTRPRRDRRREPRVRRHGRPPARGAGARAAVPHARLARAAHAADGHPRPRAGAGGRRHRHRGGAPRGLRASSATRPTGWAG